MKKSIIAAVAFAACSAFASAAYAHNNGQGQGNQVQNGGVYGGIVVGAVGQTWSGDATGKATTLSQGNVAAAGQISGNGASYQHSDAVSGGSANFGASISPAGVGVSSGTTQYATVNSYGTATGIGAPATGWSDGNQVILNGTTGFASSENLGKGKSDFSISQVGAIGAIGGAAVIGSF